MKKIIRGYESMFSNWFNAERAFSFWKGRVALYAILKALDLKEGDEVIIPGYTCVMSINPIKYLGAKPVYVTTTGNQIDEFGTTRQTITTGDTVHKWTQKDTGTYETVNWFNETWGIITDSVTAGDNLDKDLEVPVGSYQTYSHKDHGDHGEQSSKNCQPTKEYCFVAVLGNPLSEEFSFFHLHTGDNGGIRLHIGENDATRLRTVTAGHLTQHKWEAGHRCLC